MLCENYRGLATQHWLNKRPIADCKSCCPLCQSGCISFFRVKLPTRAMWLIRCLPLCPASALRIQYACMFSCTASTNGFEFTYLLFPGSLTTLYTSRFTFITTWRAPCYYSSCVESFYNTPVLIKVGSVQLSVISVGRKSARLFSPQSGSISFAK